MFEANNSPKLHQVPEFQKRGSCLIRGLIGGLIGLASCTGITSVILNSHFDVKIGNLDIGNKIESGGYAGAPSFELTYIVDSCFWNEHWENGHIVGKTSILSGNIFGKSFIIDPNPFDCK